MNVRLENKRISLKLGLHEDPCYIVMFNDTATFSVEKKTGKITVAPRAQIEELLNEIVSVYTDKEVNK